MKSPFIAAGNGNPREELGEGMIVIREENPGDMAAICKVSEQAFGQPAEAEIMDRRR